VGQLCLSQNFGRDLSLLWTICKPTPLHSSPTSAPEPAELLKCTFSDSLVTVSEGGRELGKFTVTAEVTRRVQQPCMLLHAQSQGAINDSPCGTTVTGEGRQGHHPPTPPVYSQMCLTYTFSCPLSVSIQAYLTTDLEVLEEDYHEYVKVSQRTLPTPSHPDTQGCDETLYIPAVAFLFFQPHLSLFLICCHLFSSRATVWTGGVTWCSVTGRC